MCQLDLENDEVFQQEQEELNQMKGDGTQTVDD